MDGWMDGWMMVYDYYYYYQYIIRLHPPDTVYAGILNKEC